MELQSFGYWLKRKRKALYLTREELAECIGYSATAIRKIEDVERHPSAQVVERLADIFNIPQMERSLFLKFAPAQSEDVLWHVSPGLRPQICLQRQLL